ncbi:uncharacterized protein LOC128608703 [Ictalurus furcatus]|uniref:uncharacterized protein LOC128608703 n=1 Tax=Ictalurus furcatus TaxID=66913 RepID=UPI0023500CFC|nr:uncharacterized protein LOC128608703 [Ictalurus furcatus]
MQPSSKMNVELLVSLVSECRELYDQRHSDYKNVDKKLLWQEIADQIGFDVEEVKLKWKSLCDTYMRKKREEDCRSGQAAKNKKQWKYMKLMEFLVTSTEFQSVHSNISENTDADEVDDQNDASENVRASMEISISSPAVMRSRAEKRKQSDMPDFLENYLLSKDVRDREKEERREQKREIKKDDIYFFVHGLVPALKRLSPPQLSSVKLQIQQLLHNAEFGQSSFSDSSPSGHPADPYEL